MCRNTSVHVKLSNRLVKRGADAEVIEAQKKSVVKVKGELEEIRILQLKKQSNQQ